MADGLQHAGTRALKWNRGWIVAVGVLVLAVAAGVGYHYYREHRYWALINFASHARGMRHMASSMVIDCDKLYKLNMAYGFDQSMGEKFEASLGNLYTGGGSSFSRKGLLGEIKGREKRMEASWNYLTQKAGVCPEVYAKLAEMYTISKEIKALALAKPEPGDGREQALAREFQKKLEELGPLWSAHIPARRCSSR